MSFDGTCLNLTKFMHLVDKPPRFPILESMRQPRLNGLNATPEIVVFTLRTH